MNIAEIKLSAIRILFQPAFVIFTICLLSYSYFYQAGGWNQNSRFDLIRSIVDDETFCIDKYSYNTGDLSKVDGHYYCDKAPGVSFLGTIPYALLKAIGMGPRHGSSFLSVASYLVTVLVIAVPSAIAVSMLYLLLESYALSYRLIFMSVFGYAFGTMAFPYSTLLYGHQLAAACLFTSFVLMVKRRAEQRDAIFLLCVGVILGIAFMVDYTSALAIVPMLLYAINRFGLRNTAKLIIGLSFILLLVLIYNLCSFGGAFKIGYLFSTHSEQNQGISTWMRFPSLSVLYEVSFSRYRGLFYSAPWLLCCLIGLLIVIKRRKYFPEMLVPLAIIIEYLWLNSSLVAWEGGWAMGPRYLIPMLPFLTLGTLGLQPSAGGKHDKCYNFLWLITMVLVVYSVILMLVATAVTPEVPFTVRKPFQMFLFPEFFNGNLSLNTQSIDSFSADRPGPFSAWNIGMLFGLKGKLSLIPLGIGVGLCSLWLLFLVNQKESEREKMGCMET